MGKSSSAKHWENPLGNTSDYQASYGKEALCCSAVFKWYKHFAHRRDSFEDYEYTDHPRMVRSELKIQEGAVLVCAN
jgi:hypothetical protein